MVNVRAVMVAFCPGISTAATLSREPEACGLARFRKDPTITMMTTPATASSRIFAGGRFFFAVPYSSPMLMVGPVDATGVPGFGAGAGGWSGIGLSIRRFYACARRDATRGVRLALR